MPRTGVAHLPLHYGAAPPWLFQRMTMLARQLVLVLVEEFGPLLGTEGVGAKTVRALALVSELVYGAPASFRDPVRYSYAHGGKDGHPYPVDRAIYDRTVETLKAAVSRARLGQRDRLEALRRLSAF